MSWLHKPGPVGRYSCIFLNVFIGFLRNITPYAATLPTTCRWVKWTFSVAFWSIDISKRNIPFKECYFWYWSCLNLMELFELPYYSIYLLPRLSKYIVFLWKIRCSSLFAMRYCFKMVRVVFESNVALYVCYLKCDSTHSHRSMGLLIIIIIYN